MGNSIALSFALVIKKDFFLYVVPSSGRMAHSEYGMRDVVQGLGQMDLREQEIRDLEVARKLQEEELKVGISPL